MEKIAKQTRQARGMGAWTSSGGRSKRSKNAPPHAYACIKGIVTLLRPCDRFKQIRVQHGDVLVADLYTMVEGTTIEGSCLDGPWLDDLELTEDLYEHFVQKIRESGRAIVFMQQPTLENQYDPIEALVMYEIKPQESDVIDLRDPVPIYV